MKNIEHIICYLGFSLSFRRPDVHAKGSYALLRKCLVCSSALSSANYLHQILFCVPCLLDVFIFIVDSWTCEALWSTLIVLKSAREINLTLTYITCSTGPCVQQLKVMKVQAQETATPICCVCLHSSAGTALAVVIWSLFCSRIIAAMCVHFAAVCKSM